MNASPSLESRTLFGWKALQQDSYLLSSTEKEGEQRCKKEEERKSHQAILLDDDESSYPRSLDKQDDWMGFFWADEIR